MNQKKVALVTGGTSGIGQACAIGLCKAGYAVALCGRREDRLRETAAICMEAGGEAFAIRCDVSVEADVVDMFKHIHEKFGRIDLVFNNAGLSTPAAPIDETTLENFNAAVQVNLVGTFLIAREAFRSMKSQNPQGGRIINNGSISAHVPRPNAVPYNASKHAVSGITKTISLEGRPFNIACGQIDIGNTATDMTAKMGAGMLQANGTIAPEPTFDVKGVVDALIYMSGLPLSANVQTITVMATDMPYIGRG